MKIKYLIFLLIMIVLSTINVSALTVGDCEVLAVVKKASSLDSDTYICKNKKYGEANESIYYSGENNTIKLNNFNGYYLTNSSDYDITIDITGNNNISLLHISDNVKFNVTGTGSLKFKEVSLVKKVDNGQNVNNYLYNSQAILNENKKIYEGTLEQFEEDYDNLKKINKIPSEYDVKNFEIVLVNDYTKMTPFAVTKSLLDKKVITELNKDVEDGYGKIFYVKEEVKEEKKEEKKEVKSEDTSKKNKLESDNVILISKEKVNSKYKLEVDDLKEKEISKKIEELLDNMNLLNFYDINVINDKKEVSMKNGEFTIKIKVDENVLKDYEDFQIVYVNDDGDIEEYIDTTIEDSYIIFKTSHLSQYGIVAKKIDTEVPEEKTHKNYALFFKIGILLSVVLVSSIFIGFLIIKSNLLKKKTKRKKKKVSFFKRLKHS